MDHSDDNEEYLLAGEASSRAIRQILERQGVDLTQGASVMDWGCASGRVLRHFAQEAQRGDFWGVDQHGPSILWAKNNLSPPFKFLTCTAYPHLPFEDNKFTAVYALSVFTHIVNLLDMWLMEFRRILAPGGFALFTVHDEHTWRLLSEDEASRAFWTSHGYIGEDDLSTGLKHDMTVFGARGEWDSVVTFFKDDWIIREWGQYLNVVSIEPCNDGYQSTVVLRK